MKYLLTVGCDCNESQLETCFSWIRNAAQPYLTENVFPSAKVIEFGYSNIKILIKALGTIHKLSIPTIETTAIKVAAENSYETMDNLIDRFN